MTKSRKSSHRKDLTVADQRELELKDELTDCLDSSSSADSSFVAASGDGIVSPIASHSNYNIVRSRVLSSSAPSSPTGDRNTHVSYSGHRSVRSLIAGFESLSCESVFVNMTLQEELGPLTKSRAGFKSPVTRNINKLNSLKSDNNLNVSLFRRLEQSVSNHLQEIEKKRH